MARPAMRKHGRMNNRITFRCTDEDVASLVLKADEEGMDTSMFIRFVLYKHGIIVP